MNVGVAAPSGMLGSVGEGGGHGSGEHRHEASAGRGEPRRAGRPGRARPPAPAPPGLLDASSGPQVPLDSVRLGLLGPSGEDLATLARSAGVSAERGQGQPRRFTSAPTRRSKRPSPSGPESLVGEDASDDGLWNRAFRVAAAGTPEQIDAFLRGERARLRLQVYLEGLPATELRSVEMIGDRVAVLIHDKALLDEEDIFSATFLVYGKSEGPLVKKIGSRWFPTPGPIGSIGGGVLVLDDANDEVVATLYDAEGREARAQVLTTERVAKLSVR